MASKGLGVSTSHMLLLRFEHNSPRLSLSLSTHTHTHTHKQMHTRAHTHQPIHQHYIYNELIQTLIQYKSYTVLPELHANDIYQSLSIYLFIYL